MPRKKDTITLSIPPGTKEKLEQLAGQLGIYWGKSPSISGLLVALAECQYELGPPFTLNGTQVQALEQALKLLQDNGMMGHAHTLAALLLDRGNLDPPLRQQIMKQMEPTAGWRVIVEKQYLEPCQPFRVLYRNSQGQELDYAVRYGEITFEEKRFYLHIWCEETQDADPRYPQLQHNRCLRFDRILSIVKMDGQWRSEGLDFLKVQLHFCGGMVKAYESKSHDLHNEVRGEVRQVVRRVTNPFWLFRDVRRYGGDCEIISPANLRQQFQEELKAWCRKYDLKTD